MSYIVDEDMIRHDMIKQSTIQSMIYIQFGEYFLYFDYQTVACLRTISSLGTLKSLTV